MRNAGLVVAFACGAMVACNAIIGTRDLTYDPAAADASSADAGAKPDAAGTDTGAALDAGADVVVDAGACPGSYDSDPKHCGRCGHDCLGGKCVTGLCQPVTLAAGIPEPFGVTVLGDSVYWTSYFGDSVGVARKDGTGTPTTFAADPKFARPWGITSDGTSIYFAAQDLSAPGVFKCPPGSCQGAGALVQISTKRSRDVAVRGGVAYFTGFGDSVVYKVNTDGTGEVAIDATITQPFKIAVDATHAYVTSNLFKIVRIPLAGGPHEDFGDNSGDLAGGIFVDDQRVYWTYAFYTAAGRAFAKDKTTSTVVTYANKAQNPLAIVADDANVYWISLGTGDKARLRTDGKLHVCPKAGCPAAGATILVDSLENGNALALDKDAIYFTEAGAAGVGTVKKLAK